MASPFSPEELAYLEAHKHDSRISEIQWVYSVPIAAAAISTAMRMWAKRYGRNGITLDDYLIFLATLCLIAQCASGLGFGPPHGMGKHVIVVSAHDQMMVRKGDYVFSHFYDIALVSVKLSILAFYHRVFVHPVFRRVVLATAAFVLAWGIGITVTLFMACRPLAAYWDVNVTGKCLVMVTFVYFTNISNLITDIWIFLMPVPMIWHLQLQTKKKMLLSLIFCIGLATCVVSSIRLTVVLGRGSADFTWYYVPLGAYSVFEPLGGILCTNLPIVWHMFRKRRATILDASAFKTHTSSSSHTGASRRARFSIALGITTRDRTQNDSGNRTMLGGDGGEGGVRGVGDWQRLESMESQKPDPTIWTTVERVDTGGLEEGPSEVSLKPGMKKTVWNVRK